MKRPVALAASRIFIARRALLVKSGSAPRVGRCWSVIKTRVILGSNAVNLALATRALMGVLSVSCPSYCKYHHLPWHWENNGLCDLKLTS